MLDVVGSSEIPQLVINRPRRANSVTAPILESLAEELEAVSGTATAVILTGADGRFCGGADLGELTDRAAMEVLDAALMRATSAIAHVGVPVVAAVERFTFGAGVDLAWSCDVVVAGEDVRMAIPATRLGILYHPDSLRRLHARLGSRALRQMLVLGRELTAGPYADVVCAPGEALAEAQRLAESAGGLRREAIWATKRVLDDLDHERSLALEWEALRAELLDQEKWVGTQADQLP